MLVNIKIKSASEDRIGFTIVATIEGKRCVASAFTTNESLLSKRPRIDDRFSVEIADDTTTAGTLIPKTEDLYGLNVAPKSIDWASIAEYTPGVEM